MTQFRTVESDQEMAELAHRAKKLLPDSAAVYGLLACGFRFKSIDRQKAKIFVPVAYDSLFIVITSVHEMKDCQFVSLCWDLDKTSASMVEHLVKTVPEWDLNTPFFIYGVSKAMATVLDGFLLREGDALRLTKEILIDDSYLFFLNEKLLPELQSLEEDFYLSDVPKSHGRTVHHHWMYNFLSSVEDVDRKLTFLPSTAVLSTSSSTPVAWVLTKHHGEVGLTYTQPAYRKRGFGVAAVVDLIRKLVTMGHSPHAFAAKSNEASIQFHRKIGYEIAGVFEWPKYSPPNR